MSYRHLDVCSPEELFQKLQVKLQSDFDKIRVILERWCGVRKCPPQVFKLAYVEQAEKEILEVISSLDGDSNLIKDLNAVILPGYTISCYPGGGSKARYFALLSDMRTRPRRGEIHAITQGNRDDSDAVIYDLYDMQVDLRTALTEDSKWLQVVQRSQMEGWSRYLLDLLAWHTEVKKLDYDARMMNVCVQVQMVKEMGVLPFSLDSTGLVEEQCERSNNAFTGGRKGMLGQFPVWIKYFEKVPRGTGEQGKSAQDKALEAVLEYRNLIHPNILSWSAVSTDDPAKWTLVSPRIEQNLATMMKARRGDAFKLTAIRDMALGLDYLHAKETWHGELSMANVLVSGMNSGTRRFLLTDFAMTSFDGLPSVDRQDILTIVTIPGRVIKDIGDFARVIYDIYPFENLTFDTFKTTYGDPYSVIDESGRAYCIQQAALVADEHPESFHLSSLTRWIDQEMPIEDPEPCEPEPSREPQRGSMPSAPSLHSEPCEMETLKANTQAGNLTYDVVPILEKKYEKVHQVSPDTPARHHDKNKLKGSGIGGKMKEFFGRLGRRPRRHLEVRLVA